MKCKNQLHSPESVPSLAARPLNFNSRHLLIRNAGCCPVLVLFFSCDEFRSNHSQKTILDHYKGGYDNGRGLMLFLEAMATVRPYRARLSRAGQECEDEPSPWSFLWWEIFRGFILGRSGLHNRSRWCCKSADHSWDSHPYVMKTRIWSLFF